MQTPKSPLAITRAVVLSVPLALAAAASAGDVNVDAWFAVGPSNESVGSYLGFIDNVESSLNHAALNGNVYEDRPVGMTPEDSPQAFNPMFTGDSTLTSWLLLLDNSWLAEHDPSEPFDGEVGNVLWSGARFYVSDPETTITLNQVRYLRFASWDGFGSDGVYSYQGTGYEFSLTRAVFGIHYGEDGEYGTDDDTVYTEGNGDTPVHEIRIIADSGTSIDVLETLSNGGLDPETIPGQEQLDIVVAGANAESFPEPAWFENQFWLENEDGEEIASGGSTITIKPTDMCIADLNDDGKVSGFDLGILLSSWGKVTGDTAYADLTGDGVIGGDDLAILLSLWGECPSKGGGAGSALPPSPRRSGDLNPNTAVQASNVPGN